MTARRNPVATIKKPDWTRHAVIRRLRPTAFSLAVLIGCTHDSPPYHPEIQPGDFVGGTLNAFFPLVPGMVFTYVAPKDEGIEKTVVEVLPETRLVNGVRATVVRDRVYLDGALTEDTYDWYALDRQGNVWYLGEDSREIENGEIVGTEGSWEWGVDGALPGIIMWANPASHIDESYRQEYLKGEAEDWGRVVAVDRAETVPFGSFTGCVETEDWSALESGRERKVYCPEIGLILEVPAGRANPRLELIARTTS